MRLVLISDTHNDHKKLIMPEGDLLIHAGDFTYFGNYKRQYLAFAKWFCSQPYKYKIFIAGNHEHLLEQNRQQALSVFNLDKNTHYLQNSGVQIEDLYVYGSPHQPIFCHLAFNAEKAELEKRWDAIPQKTNILVTHTPAAGFLDGGFGCRLLAQRIAQLPDLRLHVSGHIHEGFGCTGHKPMFVNASMCEEGHKIRDRRPVVVEIKN